MIKYENRRRFRWNSKRIKKKVSKEKKEGYHCYAVGYKWKDQKRPKWYKNIALAKNEKELLKRLTAGGQFYNLPKDMVVLKRLD